LYAPCHDAVFGSSIYNGKGGEGGYKKVGCLPPSRLTSGTSVIPEMTVGIPMTSPENVELPPRYSAYLLPEETMMKNVVCGVN
jgi:hypothetical protein